MCQASKREKLRAVLHQVVERRFLYYGFEVFPLELEPERWAVEVRRVRQAAPAMGTVVELADVLQKYLLAAGIRIVEAVRASVDGFAVVVEAS